METKKHRNYNKSKSNFTSLQLMPLSEILNEAIVKVDQSNEVYGKLDCILEMGSKVIL
jgi:hypothetical protein